MGYQERVKRNRRDILTLLLQDGRVGHDDGVCGRVGNGRRGRSHGRAAAATAGAGVVMCVRQGRAGGLVGLWGVSQHRHIAATTHNVHVPAWEAHPSDRRLNNVFTSAGSSK